MIPKNITIDHINQALSQIQKEGIPLGRESDRYFLKQNSQRYPPKLVISLANKFANGVELEPKNFDTYEAQDFLRPLKFSIIDIGEESKTAYNGFKLISLDLRNNRFLGTIFYDFIDENDTQDQLYTTVLIGANGTGKSNLFRVVIELFRELYFLKKKLSTPFKVDGQFSLRYSFKGKLYDFTNFRNFEKTAKAFFSEKVYYRYLPVNGIMNDYESAEFPISIVANSIMLTDKYPVLNINNEESDFSIYHYLGVRNSPQQASTRSYVRKTVEFIVDNISSDIFKKGVQKVADFLTGSPSIKITFLTANTTKFFKGNLQPIDIADFFETMASRFQKTGKEPPFKLNHYLAISKKDLILDICDFCNNLYATHRLEDISKSSTKFLSYDITVQKDYELLKEEYKLLEELRLLGFLSSGDINIGNSTKYNLQESSSGEYHFFSSMIGLMASVKPNSLIFIDEPEISLHPNWQMQYLSFIRELFKGDEYNTSHLFIATHSHFLISDLVGTN